MHEQYLNAFEISEDRVNKAKIGLYNDAYISSLRNVTESKGVIEFLAAILPCPWSYHDFACKLIEINKNLYIRIHIKHGYKIMLIKKHIFTYKKN